MTDVNNLTDAFLLAYASLFPIVNPIRNAPIFLGLTREYTEKERNALALRVTGNSFFLLLGAPPVRLFPAWPASPKVTPANRRRRASG